MTRRGRSKYHGKFKPGHVFGSWTVVTGRIHGSPARIDVKCSCGTEKSVDVYTLVKGLSISCGHADRSGSNAPNWQGINGIPATVLNKTARSIGLVANSANYSLLAGSYTSQGGTCAITSTPLTYDTAKVARLDNTKPYESGNIYWVGSDVSQFVNSAGGISNAVHTITSIASTNHSNIFEQMGMKPIKDSSHD